METEDADMENQAGASSPSRVSITSLVPTTRTWRQIEVRLRRVIHLPPAKKPVSSDVIREGEGAQGGKSKLGYVG